MSNSKIFDKVDKDIAKYGWHVLSVACEDSPSFSYTVGFEETLSHPEIIISGLSIELMHQLLNDIGELINQGSSFKGGDLSNDVVSGLPVKFIEVRESVLSEYLRVAQTHYENKSFRALPCVWPGEEGLFQTESNQDQEVLG